MSSQKQDSQPTGKADDGVSEEEIRQESSKAAAKALESQQQADELKQAARGAADADERQKLMEQAIDKQVEAQSLGKTAKYMRGGAFQGMCVGAGLGTAPGLTLGTLTGTIVGGLASTILGGLGAGVGSLVGWAHGPFWNVGEVVGTGVRKITGDLPSWKATDDQKKKLEEMIAQANSEEMPGARELKGMANDGWDGAKHQGKAWYKTGASYMPGGGPSGSTKAQDENDNQQVDDDPTPANPETVKTGKQDKRNVQEAQTSQQASGQSGQSGTNGSVTGRKQPRKLERRSGDAGTDSPSAETKPHKPRKLEVRS